MGHVKEEGCSVTYKLCSLQFT